MFSMFNERLKSVREKSGMTQKEVAEIVGISQRVYAYYETDRFPREEVTIRKLARLFDCSTDYLFGVSDFVNYEEIKSINENVKTFSQIMDPQLSDNLKDIFSSLADIGKGGIEQSYILTSGLCSVAESLREIGMYYSSLVEKITIPIPEEIQKLNFYEFKEFSSKKMETANESIKKMASELANKIKWSYEHVDKIE